MEKLHSPNNAGWEPGRSFPGCNQFRMITSLRAVITGAVMTAFLSATAPRAPAQSKSNQPQPYASIAAKGVEYSGPGREPAYDLTGTTILIGLIVPLSGPRKADGEAILAAAKMAIADSEKGWSHAGPELILKTGDESGPSWSGVTSALARLVLDEQAIAIITSSSGATAHLSEQIGNRIGVPVLTAASDKTTTQIDLPWIFRLGPTDALEIRTIAKDMYDLRNLKHVLLVTDNDHDGRRGLQEFEDAARTLGAPQPFSLILDPSRSEVDVFMDAIRAQNPEAIVFWTKAPTTSKLIEVARASGSKAPIYLSQEAAKSSYDVDELPGKDSASKDPSQGEVWTVVADSARSQVQVDFVRRYRQTTRQYPSAAAAEVYDAVRLVASAFRKAGPNRARVRDEIAKTRNRQGASGMISFDAEGNNAVQVRLARTPISNTSGELTRRN
jgi:branched-chain amino acid transport system substrate-binding protein